MPIRKYCLWLILLFSGIQVNSQEINWMSWEEAATALDKEPKKIFVDVYTDWCGWCKKMDATTFKDSTIIDELNSDFYPVKLNAEQKESIFWKGEEFKWMPSGRDGVHKLAHDLLDGQMSYPTYVILDEDYARILIAPGYTDAPMLMKELRFAAEEHYRNISWQEFKNKTQ
jgi:thioredoxin-related protein